MTQPERGQQDAHTADSRDASTDSSEGDQIPQDVYEQSGLSEYGRSAGASGLGQPLDQPNPSDTKSG